jgi:hypothetical protein
MIVSLIISWKSGSEFELSDIILMVFFGSLGFQARINFRDLVLSREVSRLASESSSKDH